MSMNILEQGQGELVGWHDPDEHRRWVRDNKTRELVDKRMSVSQAVERFVPDGALVALSGFGHIRIPMALVYEMIRQARKDLTIAGKTAVHDIDVLIGAGCVSRVEVAYAFGHEMRGLSPSGRRAVESGKTKVVAEISNAAYQWRFLAAAMGIPFMPARTMLGTDTFRKSSAKAVTDPWSGKPICLVPACYPDVGLFHVHRCDRYGNAQLDGILVMDYELARSCRRLVITAEEIVDDDVIRNEPGRTTIPYFLVDAVCHVPYGSHPGLMPYEYHFDEDHIRMWLSTSKTEAGAKEYLDRYVYGAKDFDHYIELIGGRNRMDFLNRVELYKDPAPGRREV